MLPLPEEEKPDEVSGSAVQSWVLAMVRAALEDLEPAEREAAAACAVPRWFNQDLLLALMGDRLAPSGAERILEQMRGWEFVRSLGQGRYMFRDTARAAILAELAPAASLALLHARAQAYFDRQLGEVVLDESAWMRLRPEQFNLLREKVYHMLRRDARQGYDVFRQLFRGAHAWYLPGEAEALMHTLQGMDLAALPQSARDELAFFEAVQDAADYRYETAEARLNALLEQSQPPVDPTLRARVQGELGKLLAVTGRLNEAAVLFGQAQAAFQRLGGMRESAAIANNMGSVYLNLRDFRAARAAFQQALDGLRQYGSEGDQAQAYNNLGTAWEREEEWSRALEHYQTSLALKEQIGDSFGAARTRANIGSVYHAQIRDVDDARRAARLRDSALALYEQSLATFQQFGARTEAARVQFKQALLYYQSGQVQQARAALPDVLEEYRALRIPGVEHVENLAALLEG